MDILPLDTIGLEFAVHDFSEGEWMDYTFAVLKSGRYRFSLDYEADSLSSLSYRISGNGKVGDIEISEREINLAPKSVWTRGMGEPLELGAGVYTLRLTSKGYPFRLNRLHWEEADEMGIRKSHKIRETQSAGAGLRTQAIRQGALLLEDGKIQSLNGKQIRN
jgi:hypothetical protein